MFFSAFVILVSVSCTPIVHQSKITKPNIIFILNDDLGWGDVGYHGSEIRTPTLDALAKRGVELNRYYTYAVCSPTRAALLSGRSSLESGVDAPIGLTQVLPMETKLLPQYLKEQGYQTAMVGKWHLGLARSEYLPMNRGFDTFYGFLNGYIDHYTHLTAQGRLDWQRNGVSIREKGHTTDLLTDEAIKKLRNRDKNKPIFLYLAYDAPHTPLQAPEEYVKRNSHITDPVRRTFAAMVEHNDAQLARILATVESEGISRNTLIIWASDNGPELRGGGTGGGLRAGKWTSFEGGQRVPAIAYWPSKIKEGQRLESPITVLDWLPTLLNISGAPPAKDARVVGNNIFNLLADTKAGPTLPFIIGNRSQGANGSYFESAFQWPYKLVRSSARNIGPKPLPSDLDPMTKISMLFDVVTDPGETHDIATEYLDLVKILEARLNAAPRALRSLSESADVVSRGIVSTTLNPGLPGGANPLVGYLVEKGEPLAEAALRLSEGAPP